MDKKIQKRSLETRDRIIEATRNLFVKHGRENVSTDQIAAAANVAKGTIFAHFSDRANLEAAVTLDDLDAILSRVANYNAQLRGRDWIIAAYGQMLTEFEADPDVAKTFVRQTLIGDGEWTTLFNQKCLNFETLIVAKLDVAYPGQDVAVLLGGAQAFFLQILAYRNADWISFAEAKTRLAQYLQRWLP